VSTYILSIKLILLEVIKYVRKPYWWIRCHCYRRELNWSYRDDVVDARYSGTGANTNATNLAGAAATILGLTPLFFSLGIMSAGVAIAVGGLRNAGLV